MQKLDMNKVIARMQSSVGLVHASLVDSVQVTPEIHRVIVSFNTQNSTKESRYLAIAKLFNNEASPIKNSFRELSGVYNSTSCGFIVVNTESKPFTEEMASSGKYQTIAANCLMDKDDESLWEVTSSGENKFLVRKAQEDLSKLVALASMKNQTPKYQRTTLASVINKTRVQDFIAYVDQETATVKYGYVLADVEDFDLNEEPQLEVLDTDTQDSVQVNPELVVDAATLNGDDEGNLPKTETAGEYDLMNKESMKAYYKQMFSYSPEYYNQLAAIIDGHATV